MTTKTEVISRREKVSLCLSKSMTSAAQISKHLGVEYKTIENDLYWMRKNSRKWLSGHTLDGYIFSTKNTIEQMKDMELQLQSMRSLEKDPKILLMIIRQLTEVINMRWVMEGDGPTLMHRKYAGDQFEKSKATEKAIL